MFHKDAPIISYFQKTLNSCSFSSLASAFASNKHFKAANAHDVWFAEDDRIGYLSVGLDDLGRLYLKERPISFPMVPISTINTNYGK